MVISQRILSAISNKVTYNRIVLYNALFANYRNSFLTRSSKSGFYCPFLWIYKGGHKKLKA